MTSRLLAFVPSLFVLLLPVASHADDIFACGSGQVRRYSEGRGGWQETWRWTARDAKDLSPAFRNKLLDNIDDCKPLSGGRSIMITASTGGVVLLNAEDKTVRFSTVAMNAHSVELLPEMRLVVAISIHEQGNRFQVYDLKSGKLMFHVPATTAHGVVWDEKRKRLFALSGEVLQAFELENWQSDKPSLREAGSWNLPGKRDGHDLARDANGNYLVTTADAAWRFDPEAGRFSPLLPLNPAENVKAVNVTKTGRMAWVQSEESWWAKGFQVLDQDGKPQRVATPDMNLYKVRWVE